MDTRTKIAVEAMHGMLSCPNVDHTSSVVSVRAVLQADALLAELAKGQPIPDPPVYKAVMQGGFITITDKEVISHE